MIITLAIIKAIGNSENQTGRSDADGGQGYTKGTLNSFLVLVPLFRNINNEAFYVWASGIIPPGVYGGYQKEDIVMVAFLVNNINEAVILGKIYGGPQLEDNNKAIGAIKASTANFNTANIAKKLTVGDAHNNGEIIANKLTTETLQIGNNGALTFMTDNNKSASLTAADIQAIKADIQAIKAFISSSQVSPSNNNAE